MYESNHKLIKKSSSKSTTEKCPPTKQFLSSFNFNALAACPRRGGYLKVLLPRKVNFTSASDFASQTKFETSGSKSDTRSRSSLPSKSKLSLCLSQTSNVSASNINNPDKLLAITISCVMMMASNERQIDSKYFMFAERYLSCIKDNLGNIPPNINGILNHIKYLQRVRTPNRGSSRGKSTSSANNCVMKLNRSESSIKTKNQDFSIEANKLKPNIVDSKNFSRSRIPKRISKPSGLARNKKLKICQVKKNHF